MSEHDLYKTGDLDAPHQIKDRNNEVVLRLCRRCGRAESWLTHPCEVVSEKENRQRSPVCLPR